jgi:hypothetical protein
MKIAISLFFVIIISCSSDKIQSVSNIVINNEKSEYKQQINKERIKKIKYTIFETNKESFFSERIEQIFLTKDRIILSDSKRMEGVWIFDHKGKFINKISPKGEGPREYISARCISIDTFLRRIEVFADTKESLITFSFDGNFLNERRVNIYYDTKVYSGNGENCYQILDANMNKIGAQIIHETKNQKYAGYFYSSKLDPIWKFGVTSMKNSIFESHGSIFYYKPFCDSIYSINKSSYKLHKLLRFKSTKDIRPIMDKTSSSAISAAFNNNIPFVQDFYYETNDYSYLTYMYKKNVYFYLYDNKKNMPILNCSMVSIPQIGLPLPASTLDYCSNGIVCLLPHSLMKLIMSTLSPEDKKKISPELLKIYNKMKPEDNPILIKIEFK